MMEEKELTNAFRRSWLLVLAGLIYLVVFFLLVLAANRDAPPPDWDMNGAPFVPASSPYADGYYLPVPAPGVAAGAQEAK